jgi:hypothetical protein
VIDFIGLFNTLPAAVIVLMILSFSVDVAAAFVHGCKVTSQKGIKFQFKTQGIKAVNTICKYKKQVRVKYLLAAHRLVCGASNSAKFFFLSLGLNYFSSS